MTILMINNLKDDFINCSIDEVEDPVGWASLNLRLHYISLGSSFHVQRSI